MTDDNRGLEAGCRNGEAAFGVDGFDDFEGADTFTKAGGGVAGEADIFQKGAGFEPPRIVAAHVFKNGGLGRTHFRQHLVVGETLGAVAAAEAVDGELRVATVDFEGEEIFPFGAARMEPSGLAGGGAEAEKGIVIDFHVPERGRGMAFDGGKTAEKPAGKIDQMDALVDEFAAAG